MATPLLDQIKTPKDLRALSQDRLQDVVDELRQEVIEIVSHTGGHLGASLGVVELTVALHHIFNTPEDKLIWDVGHQAYSHKLLTGRRGSMRKLRQKGGVSGFTKRAESPFDPFGAAHAGTSISAALGYAVARDLKNEDHKVIAVIGDGAMSTGMAYEALNNAGSMASRLLVVLNDNDMSIAPPVGAMSAYLSRLLSSRSYHSLRKIAKDVVKKLPKSLEERARRLEELTRGFMTGGTLFEELGFFYVGPIDGHRLDHLLPVLENIKNRVESGPILLHVVTKKGYGYAPAEAATDKFHGVSQFDVHTGIQNKGTRKAPSYTSVFADSLIQEAEKDDKILAITAAMPAGTGVDKFSDRFPDRAFDVGIAEQHAVTYAAGLACDGFKPFVAIYSTFLQRAYDQVVHDVMLQKLPVRFAIDRAGYVGADGATHMGAYDVGYLGNLPGMVVMAAADEAELKHMVTTAAAYDEGPISFRYPRGDALGVEMPQEGSILQIGRGRILKEGTKIAVLSLGARLKACLDAAEVLTAKGFSTTVADARFAKPLDEDLLVRLAQNHEVLILIEEGAIGGFATQALHVLAKKGILDTRLKVRPMVFPDRIIHHDNPAHQYIYAGLDAPAIVDQALQALGGNALAKVA